MSNKDKADSRSASGKGVGRMVDRCKEVFTADSFKRWISQPQVWGFFVSMAVMAIVSVAFFAPNNFAGDQLSQSDQVQGAANGAEAKAYEEATGEKALWTNSLFGGMPTFQISPSYPSNSLFTWLNSVFGLGLPAPSNLLFMMMFGFLIMCYCWKLRWWYGLIGALAWGLSSYFVIIIGAGHIWKFVALTYMPPIIGAMALAYRGRWFSGGALLAVFTMLQLNANHPQITYYTCFIVAALAIAWLVRDIREHRMRRWLTASAACLVAAALGLGANLPSLYNTYEYAKETKRAGSELSPAKDVTPADASKAAEAAGEQPTGGLPKGEIGGWSNMPSETMTLLVPNVKGGATARLTGGRMQGQMLSSAPGLTQEMVDNDAFSLLQNWPQYFGGKRESGGTNGPFYFGALICAFFLLGCFIVKGPEKWALLIVSAFSVLLAMGNHFPALTDWMIYHFPMYNKFRAAETTLVIAALCVPLLAVMALQKLMTTPDALNRYRRDLIASFGFTMVLCFIAWVWPSFYGSPLSGDEQKMVDEALGQMSGMEADYLQSSIESVKQLRLELVSTDGLRSLLILIAGCILTILALKQMITKAMGVLGIGVTVVFDLYNVDKRYVASDSFVTATSDFTDPLEPDAIDREISKDKGYYRVLDYDNFGSPVRSAHHHMVGGYHAAKLNRFNDLIERGAIAMPGVADMLNARYLISRGQLQRNETAMGAAWLTDSLHYVDNADAEMAALLATEEIELGDSTHSQKVTMPTFDPAQATVVDKRFAGVLGAEQPNKVPGDTIQLTKYTPNSVSYDVTTKNGGVAVFSEIYFPWGWHATIDGKEVELARVNYVLRALRVPAGSHKIEMVFDPDSIHVTSGIAYGCVTLIYLLALLALFFVVIRDETPGPCDESEDKVTKENGPEPI